MNLREQARRLDSLRIPASAHHDDGISEAARADFDWRATYGGAPASPRA
jgi:hypothetical protein